MTETNVHLLGTGNAFNTDARACQAVLLTRDDGPTVLVDVGPTIGLSLEQFGVETGSIDTVVFTHLHGDHIAGWPFLLLRLIFLDGRTRSLDVVGPVGIRQSLDGLMSLCYGEIFESDRVRFEIRYRELPVKTTRGVECGEGLTLDVWPMEHHESSLGYRFEIDGLDDEGEPAPRSIGVTGDTRWCDNIEKLAAQCDLLLLECTLLEPGESKHVSLAELRDKISTLRDAGCSALLVHTDDSVADALEAQPIKGVLVGQDGMILSL